ncbi:MAG TPA: YceI family protein [Abditibacteriaceae bacterium]
MLQRHSGWSGKWGAPATLAVVMGATALSGGRSAQAAITYKVVPGHSRITAISETKSPLKRLQHERELRSNAISGSIVFSAPNKPASLTMNAKANSFRTVKKHELSDNDVAKIDQVTRDSILEAGKYPNVTFKSTRINFKPSAGGAFKGTVMGNLTMHGVTRAVSVPISGKISGNLIKAKGSFKVNQSDFGMTIISIMGGIISARDMVEIKLDLTAKK